MRQPTVRYQNFMSDSARWDGFEFRAGDIVISTPAKCGTTWTQMICALLIFQSQEFPAPLDAMSVWLDSFMYPRERLVADLAAQRHRRFIKTHTPLDGLPRADGVSYLCVGRDPRDAAISWDNHARNLNLEAILAMRAATVGSQPPGAAGGGPPPAAPAVPDPSAPPSTELDRFWAWADDPDMSTGLAALLHHLTTFWRERHAPDVVLLHYDDLKQDLAGQMRQLAGRLGIEVPEERWPQLVRWATFETMRGNADVLTPEIDIWQDPVRFFHRGSSGQWRALLDHDDLVRYQARVRQLAESDVVEWVHRGPIVG